MKNLTLPKVLFLVLLGALLTLLAVNFTSDKEKQVRKHIEHRYAVDDPQFVRSMGVLLGPALVDGNRVETLLNGDEIFPAMLAAIRGAKQTLTFETYIYWSGKVGKDFADALAERARAGVKVHILLDWVGSQKMEKPLLEQMAQAGIEIQRYHPLTWHSLDRVNNRTHRKLLVADGRVGFTGGVGIADDWSGHAQDQDHWRDTHYRIEGPAVAQMQAAFNDNWLKVSGVVLHGDAYFPPITPAGQHLAQMFKSSPDGGSDSMHLMYLLSVAAATKTIDLSMAYFVPDDLALEALVAALKRGVRVRIIMPGKLTDSKAVRSASRALWGDILKAGAELYEYQPTMYHCKVLVVDGLWVSVGSTNFDVRSFRLNDEANLNVHDRDFAARQLADFENDLKRSRRITYEEWAARPWKEKAVEHFLALFRSQL
ncbi:MAG: phospholipase D-like domain-containing protein [Pseudomonadota bacterium]|nr:phospholipase D-like domain-containing protein [Pseudomonadota bacterium]